MARFKRPDEPMSLEDLGLLLEIELPLPDPVIDREEWRTVIHRRYDRAAQFGFDELDVLRGSCAEKRARLDGHGWLMRPIGEGDLNGTGA